MNFVNRIHVYARSVFPIRCLLCDGIPDRGLPDGWIVDDHVGSFSIPGPTSKWCTPDHSLILVLETHAS